MKEAPMNAFGRLLTSATIAAALFSGAAAAPVAASGVPAPTTVDAIYADAAPACTYADVAASNTSYADWAIISLDTTYRVSSSYAPPDLRATGIAGGGSVRALVVPDLQAMANAAAAAGAPIAVASSYRSYNTQVSTFNYWVNVSGYSAALLASARPGHSEHQLGTALDFTSRGGAAPWTYADWATSAAGAWMKAHAWEYGFINSYPKGKSPSITCYQYEPWHYRYFGLQEAAAIHASGLTSRQWLWANGGANSGAGAAAPTPAPKATSAPVPTIAPTPVPRPVATPAQTATPTPAASPSAADIASPPAVTPPPVTTVGDPPAPAGPDLLRIIVIGFAGLVGFIVILLVVAHRRST
jgi:D-alanyl-D-alanine carboxypeptidase